MIYVIAGLIVALIGVVIITLRSRSEKKKPENPDDIYPLW